MSEGYERIVVRLPVQLAAGIDAMLSQGYANRTEVIRYLLRRALSGSIPDAPPQAPQPAGAIADASEVRQHPLTPPEAPGPSKPPRLKLDPKAIIYELSNGEQDLVKSVINRCRHNSHVTGKGLITVDFLSILKRMEKGTITGSMGLTVRDAERLIEMVNVAAGDAEAGAGPFTEREVDLLCHLNGILHPEPPPREEVLAYARGWHKGEAEALVPQDVVVGGAAGTAEGE